MPLVTYAETKPWARRIAVAVDMKMMPPWFADPRYGNFSNDPSLSAEQIKTIGAWADAGRRRAMCTTLLLRVSGTATGIFRGRMW